MTPQFNPFDLPLEKVEANDLKKLYSVSEGWYIEYKSDIVSSKNVAKSLSAFANHYGGWIFYGVSGAKDGSNIADSFPGINKAEALRFLEQIRDAARNSLTPSPYYDYKIIYGPCDEISLSVDKCIIIIVVPTGLDAPYIHSDGRIYRRVSDASDPRPENDRFILDQLWQRRQKAQDKLKDFLQQKQHISDYQSGVSFVELFLFHDPLGIKNQKPLINYEDFVELLSEPDDNKFGIRFDNFYYMAGGFIARNILGNDLKNIILTWRYYFDGSSIITIPIPSFRLDEYKHNITDEDYRYISEFISLAKYKHNDFIFIDFNKLLLIISLIVFQYKEMIQIGGVQGRIYSKISLNNAWMRIPFIDKKNYITHIEKYGFPMIYFNQEYAPPGIEFDSLLVIENIEDGEDYSYLAKQLIFSAPIYAEVAGLLGIPKYIISDRDLLGSMFRAIGNHDFDFPEGE